MSCHWTFEYIDEQMTLPRLAALSAYWQHSPPVHISIASYLGIKPVARAPVKMPAFMELPEFE